jgi:hypothetical protein
MPIHTRTWLGRLTRQCPGWFFWYDDRPWPHAAWHAVPAPHGRVPQPVARRNRVDAPSPQLLRQQCGERYGWYDRCEACGVPARECGHDRVRSRTETNA